MSEIVKYISVKFEATNKTYTFKTSDTSIKNGDCVVVETQRGLELATVVGDPFDKPNISLEIKDIIRKATEQDIRDYKENIIDATEAKIITQEESDKLNLGMNIISAEYTLDRSKITFIYLADDRVDFRELLKILASIFHCRIDLRQIGTRDKAKMVSGLGTCGRELCCSKFISEFELNGYLTYITELNEYIIAQNTQANGGNGGYILNKKWEKLAYLPYLCDISQDSLVFDYPDGSIRIIKIYSLDELLDIGRFELTE